jgi:hypothetical protein
MSFYPATTVCSFIVLDALVAAVAEEARVRGYVQERREKKFGPVQIEMQMTKRE